MNTPHTALAQALVRAVLDQDFGATADSMRAGQAVQAFPSIDLAVLRFAPGSAPQWANVLFSREHPQGVVAAINDRAGPVQNLRFDADLQGAGGVSVAWQPGADWSRLPWRALHGSGPMRFVAPYPASLLKLMVAVGVGRAVDAGSARWAEVLPALEPMITISDNDTTDTCVALLHRTAQMAPLNQLLQTLTLHTLQLNRTTAAGGWRNGQGSGVGHIHMTAWDTVRLLWLLDADAPPPPWLPPGTPPLLQPATRDGLRALLARQQLDEILSSGALRGVPGWVPGLPDAPAFAHKTGTTENYASDAGVVKTDQVHYIVALLSNLGSRYAPHERCATTWRLPALGAAVHRLMTSLP
jgi:hypothetical protein